MNKSQSFENTRRLIERIELEFEKGPGYWMNKYLRLKEKMQKLIDEKEDED